ncbi:hypothetical protein K402DRAFT_394149 [Aulographum hederae CBS 113979]|uniref:Exocyst complex component Sec8 n=1 Tax=Aulographum hederae CBS 113979 TaxID=1176131 RepID=A0A6G1GYM8_9PEZI|nr:hypothetical protein K402DRAFT_394149 [Aulographum hederae CBS 113979]
MSRFTPSNDALRANGNGYGSNGGYASDRAYRNDDDDVGSLRSSNATPSNWRDRRGGGGGGGGGGGSGYGGYGGTSPGDAYGSSGGYGTRSYRSPQEQPPASRRPGGYGGFGGLASPSSNMDDSEEDGSSYNRPSGLERTAARRRSGGSPRFGQSTSARSHGRNRSIGLSRGFEGDGDGTRAIEEVLRYIQQDWDFMTDEKCVPIQIALQLMDSSSLGLATRYEQFQDTSEQLQNALRAIVNEHHQGFNSSIGTFHSIQASIQSSQQRLRTLKDSLVSAKLSLSTAKPELRGFATASQNYDDMLQVLGTIEQLQSVPERLEAQISEKRFLSAVDILQDGLRLMRKSEMDNIGALSDLRVYLSNQEHSLTDILIEELHSHLYLKSPYCENRWKQYAHNQKATPGEEDSQAIDSKIRKLFLFLDKLDTSVVATEDPTRNPEADTFMYIQLLIEALNNLSRLDVAIETIEQRLPIELFRVIERCNNEVDQRHPSSLRNAKTGSNDINPNNPVRAALLQDLLWTVYARFEAIAEGHRVVHDVVAGIVKREGFKDTNNLARSFKELWKLYQSEIRSVLHDYLATDSDLASKSQGAGGGGSLFQRHQRDKAKTMFKLSDMDSKSQQVNSEKEELDSILKSSVPGLVSDTKRTDALVQAQTPVSTEDGGATGHKLLIEPSVFNMGLLLPPSLAFLKRLREVVPPSADIALSTLTSFLDDFLVNVFLPQLEETLVDLFSQTYMENDAFQQDPQWTSYAQKPIFHGTARFFDLISAFCSVLDNLPHDQAFTQLIITQMEGYFEKCREWYTSLVTRSSTHSSGRELKASAAYTESGELHDVLVELSSAGEEDMLPLIEKSANLLIFQISEEPLEQSDLLQDQKAVSALCLLYSSMRWVTSKTKQLRLISDRAIDSGRDGARKSQLQRRWTAIATPEGPQDSASIYLPLNQETAISFDAVVSSLTSLATTALLTLHTELRLRVLFHLSHSLSHTHLLPQPILDPDPSILLLNAAIVAFDEDVALKLPPAQLNFLRTGLARLIDAALLSMTISRVKEMNLFGCQRVQLNMLVLQQNLKNVETQAGGGEVELSRSLKYFDLFDQGPESVVRSAREQGREGLGFGFEEMKGLIELAYSEGCASERREVAVGAKRAADEKVLELSEYLWD